MESVRERRRKNAAIRLKLGFDDKGKDEVDDKIIEDLEYNDTIYRTQQAELKERKPVKIITDIKGISKDELKKCNAQRRRKVQNSLNKNSTKPHISS